MFIAAKIMTASQLPLEHDPLIRYGRYCVLSMFLNAATSVDDQPALVVVMISAARGQTEPVQPDCSGALLLMWPPVSLLDQAFMILIALLAYVWLPVKYQRSAWVYAAIESRRS